MNCVIIYLNMKQKICLLLVTIQILFENVFGMDDKRSNFSSIIESHGYPTEVHEIETEDGYLLDVFRVPYGRKSTTKKPNIFPVILNHGLLGSAENFILGGPKKALAYVLADKGYDVWLCNARGTWHSRKHKTLDPDRDMHQFWRFTWHEIGVYDLPATIEYVLKNTGREKLHFVGHSQGTTTFFAMMSERPEYNEKINVMVAMAPSALLSHIREFSAKLLAPLSKYLQILAESLRIYELIPKYWLSTEAVHLIGRNFCDEQAAFQNVCSNLMIAFGGFSPEQLDPATVPLIVSTSPAGSSVYQALHYAQLVTTGKFIKYDWGQNENLRRYNSTEPPEYNLENVKCPVSLIYGEKDVLVTKEDVAVLATKLPNVIDVYKVPYEKWSHMDFIMAKDVDKYLNKHLLRVLKKYT